MVQWRNAPAADGAACPVSSDNSTGTPSGCVTGHNASGGLPTDPVQRETQ